MNDAELISPEVLQLIQLFSAQGELRFPELDAGVLHDAVGRVKELHLEVTRLDAMVTAARAALEDEQEGLLRKAQRAHAYLRVFAETNEALNERVEAIALPRPRRTSRAVETTPSQAAASPTDGAPVAPKRRGRPRKVTNDGSLFAVTASTTSGSEGAAGGQVS